MDLVKTNLKNEQVSFFNNTVNKEDYLLEQKRKSIFYTLLDVNGNEVKTDLNIVHQFDNGLLLTYTPFSKMYKSSDGYRYAVNYNVYSVYNYTTDESLVINIIQSDNLLETKFKSAPQVTVLKDFMSGKIYKFNDFIFSEIVDSTYVIVGTHLSFSVKAPKVEASFDALQNKKIWGIADLSLCKAYTGETDVEDAMLSGCIFKEVEYTLYNLVTFPGTNLLEEKEIKAKKEKAEKRNLEREKVVINVKPSFWKRPKWQTVLNNFLTF
ncbi:hypothetical protein GCM10007424_00790 [Flavobacterium suaedae]|uniref:Uncharacterized protein n=1 Tax=Flavobacterium suaedae TaxID=1767027 RepID=A0ABQ1JBZ3_9FLAO|nr:hypothetical protein [Flavobacterium suaedae]GGB64731.1 hypothetical protein GCM10007424_00790 [Flavobacterium suaedae]